MENRYSNPFEELNLKIDRLIDAFQTKVELLEKDEVAVKEQFLDTKEVAEIFNVSKVSIWQWEKANILKSYRIGKLKRFKYSEVMSSPKLIERKQHSQRP